MSEDGRRPGFSVDPISYSYRETNASIWRNRIGVTSMLFTVTMGLSYLLGRPRK
ncbi:hypothetical protein GCM10025783_31770 [Amnibacterium soli]|jgi:hypothetical protein|uniref:Uncharacterized protein n=1 Tax=Amnibacterium soli TaxID=1282736 RepID=A0ABP8ZGI4_9MICO